MRRIGDNKAFESAIITPVPERFGLAVANNAPAQSPENIFGELFWSVIGAVCAFRINRDLRCFHFAKGSGLEASTIQNGRDKQGIVMRRCVECRRRAGVFWLPQVLRRGVAVVARSSALIEVRAPNVAAAGHAEGSEHQLRHDVVQRLAFDFFDHSLQVNKAFTGVAEAFAGSEVDGERIAVIAPVAESGTMAEHDTGSD